MFARFIRWLRAQIVGVVIWCLILAGGFFTIEVERMRTRLRHTGGADFVNGERVIVVAPIDGDEFSVVDKKGERVVVRLVGIKTFSPGRSNPYEGRYGKQAFEFLKGLEQQPLTLTLNTPPRDKKGRVLAFATTADERGFDVGQRMIERGIAVAYGRYGHEREEAYVRAEEQAIAQKRGLWSDRDVAERVRVLKRQWFIERSKEE